MFENVTVKEMMQSMTTRKLVELLHEGLWSHNGVLVSNGIHQLCIRSELPVVADAVNDFLFNGEFDYEDSFANVLATTLLEIKGYSPVLARLGRVIQACGASGYFRNFLRDESLDDSDLLDLVAFYNDPSLPDDPLLEKADSVFNLRNYGDVRRPAHRYEALKIDSRWENKGSSFFSRLDHAARKPLSSEELDELRRDGLVE